MGHIVGCNFVAAAPAPQADHLDQLESAPKTIKLLQCSAEAAYGLSTSNVATIKHTLLLNYI